MNEFGDLGFGHFIDLNSEESPYLLPYTAQIKACENSERLLNYLQTECKKHHIKINPPKNIDGFLQQLKILSDSKKKALNLLFEEIQKEIMKQEAFIQTQSSQLKEAEQTLTDLTDCLQVMKTAQEMLPDVEQRFQQFQGGNDIEGGQAQRQPLVSSQVDSNFSKIAGVLDSTEVERLKRLVFRATKGKSFVFTQDFVDHGAGADEAGRAKKSVYIIMYWDGELIREKIQRICDSFTGNRYELPNMNQMDAEITRVTQRIDDAQNVFHQTQASLRE